MVDKRRLAELGMPTELAKEVSRQIESGGGFDPGDIPADSTADDIEGLVTDFNALLAVLRGA